MDATETRDVYDLYALWECLEGKRLRDGLTWEQVADAVGAPEEIAILHLCPPKLRVEDGIVHAAAAWLKCPADAFRREPKGGAGASAPKPEAGRKPTADEATAQLILEGMKAARTVKEPAAALFFGAAVLAVLGVWVLAGDEKGGRQ